MLENMIAALIVSFCNTGEPIDNWYTFASERDFNLGRVVNTIRFTSDSGVVNVLEWSSGILFVTNPDSDHGHCARQKINE